MSSTNPSSSQMSNTRSTRIKVNNIKANYVYKDSSGDGVIVDMSTTGLAMEVRQIFLPGDLLRVQFRIVGIGGENVEVDLWGIVRNITGHTIGLSYEEVSNNNLDHINHFVNTMIQKLGRNARESI